MSNLSKLLTIADNNAFSNLYDVTINKNATFNLRVESIQVDGYNIDYKLNDSTRQAMLQKVNRPRSIQMTVRESGDYALLKYLSEWLVNFYDPKKNVYIAGADFATPASAGENDILRKRPIKIEAWGNSPSKDIPDLTIGVTGAMIEKCPSLSLSWADSKPITYQVSFVCEYIEFKFGTIALSTMEQFK